MYILGQVGTIWQLKLTVPKWSKHQEIITGMPRCLDEKENLVVARMRIVSGKARMCGLPRPISLPGVPMNQDFQMCSKHISAT